jgi:hypothetical protein
MLSDLLVWTEPINCKNITLGTVAFKYLGYFKNRIQKNIDEFLPCPLEYHPHSEENNSRKPGGQKVS